MFFIDLSPLRHRDFRRLYVSQFISLFGSQMTMITVPFQVYAITGSTFQTGLVSAVELVCLVSSAMWGGALADRVDRRKIIIVAEILMALMVALLGVNASLAEPSLVLIYAVCGVVSALNGFHRPAFEALTPMLVPKSELAKVSSLSSVRYVIASLFGPSLAGFLVSSVGPKWTYFADTMTFVVSLGLLLRIAKAEIAGVPEAIATSSPVRQIVDGMRYLFARRDILGTYIVDWCAMAFCMPQVLFPAFAKHYDADRWLGGLYASAALGSFVAAVFSRWTTRVKRLGVAISCAAFGWSVSILFVGGVAHLWAIPVGLFLAGAFDTYSGMFRLTMWNESIPDVYRGRLASLGMLSYTSGPLLGNTIMGLLGDAVGLHRALALGGAMSLAAVVVTSALLPTYWRYRSSDAVPAG